MNLKLLQSAAAAELSPKRLHHTLCVADMSEKLALLHGVSPVRARAAALLHDICKEKSRDFLLQFAENDGILSPKTLHAPAGAAFVKQRLFAAINFDQEILDAIRYHTTGRAGMSMLEKITYVADSVSGERGFPGVEGFRALAKRDIDAAALAILADTIRRLAKASQIIHPDTLSAYNDFINKRG